MGKRKKIDKETILKAAAELAEEKGLENATLNRLAEKLEIKTPSLYNHMSGLNELTESLAQFAIRKLEAVLLDSAVGKAKEEALSGIAMAYRRYAKENPELYKAILRIPASRDEELRREGLSVVGILHQVMEPYRYSKEDEVHFIRGFRSALHGFVSLEEAGFFDGKVDADASYVRLVSGLTGMLAVREVP